MRGKLIGTGICLLIGLGLGVTWFWQSGYQVRLALPETSPEQQLDALRKDRKGRVDTLLKERGLRVWWERTKIKPVEDLDARMNYPYMAKIEISFSFTAGPDREVTVLGHLEARYRYDKKAAAWEFVGYSEARIPSDMRDEAKVTLDEVLRAFGDRVDGGDLYTSRLGPESEW